MIRLKSAGKTDVGLKREENEDNFIMLPDHGLYVLADGMGGHASGKMASTLAVTLITEFIAVRAVKPDFQFEYATDDNLAFEGNVLANAIKYASERIFIESCKDRSMEGMGTTVTAILATDNDFVLAHVGDSRIYRMREGKLQQMTVDHSLLNHMIEIGEIKPEDAGKFANKNVILRAVGLKDTVQVSVQVVPKRAGDTYMMCSDGLSDLVEGDVIAEVLRTAESLPAACNQLIQLALRAGGKDNVTVVCVSAEDVPPGEELGWGTGTFTRKQAEAAAMLGAGASPGAMQTRSVQRPRSPVSSPSAQVQRPPTMSGGAGRPQRGAMPPEPAGASSARMAAPEQAPGARMHAVRTPLGPNGRRAANQSQGWEDAPPQRGGAAMPAPPPRQMGGAPAERRRAGAGGTPPAPLEPVDSPWASAAQEAPLRQRPAAFGPGAGPSSADMARRAAAAAPPPAAQPADRSGRRRNTPTDMPSFAEPSSGSYPVPDFAEAPSEGPARPPSGAYAAPPMPAAAPPRPAGNAAGDPASFAQRMGRSSGIFQAPPPGVFPQQRPGQPPAAPGEAPAAATAPAALPPGAAQPSRDTVEDVPVITRQSAPVARDTVRDVPIVSRGQQAPPDDTLDEDDPEESRSTTLVPQITRGQVAPEPASGLGRPLSGEGAVTDRTSYRDEGSIQIDTSLFTETQDDEDSIVVDESLLLELDDDEGGGGGEITHRGPPPPPPTGGGEDTRRGTNRPTELLPITGVRRKS